MQMGTGRALSYDPCLQQQLSEFWVVTGTWDAKGLSKIF